MNKNVIFLPNKEPWRAACGLCKQAVTSWLTHPWFQHPLNHEWGSSSCTAPRSGVCTRAVGAANKGERQTAEPWILLWAMHTGPFYHLLLTGQMQALHHWASPILPCVSVNLFLFFNSSFGDFHFLILKYSDILIVFQLHKNQLRIFALLVLYGHDLILESIGEGKY